jgi:hypothetical protein
MDLYTQRHFLEAEVQRRTAEMSTAVRQAREARSAISVEALRRFSERNFARWVEPGYGYK